MLDVKDRFSLVRVVRKMLLPELLKLLRWQPAGSDRSSRAGMPVMKGLQGSRLHGDQPSQRHRSSQTESKMLIGGGADQFRGSSSLDDPDCWPISSGRYLSPQSSASKCTLAVIALDAERLRGICRSTER